MSLKNYVAAILFLCPTIVFGQLVVKVSKPKFVGIKADIKLEIENKFPEKVESARANLFLVDKDGKMIGQATQWVIDGEDRPALPPGEKRNFHFVLSTKDFATTNLTPKLKFNPVVLEGGKTADPRKSAIIEHVKD